MSRECVHRGLDVFPVLAARSAPSVIPAVSINYDDEKELAAFNEILDLPNLAILFLSLPRWHRQADQPSSQQVLNMLSHIQRSVTKGNSLGVPVVLEAPDRYATWTHPLILSLLPFLPHCVRLQPCKWDVHSVQRRWLTLCSNVDWFSPLGGPCPHHAIQPHAYDYSKLPRHPYEFAAELAKVVVRHLTHDKALPPPQPLLHDAALYPQLLRRKHQPRGAKLPSLIPDFKAIVIVDESMMTESSLPTADGCLHH